MLSELPLVRHDLDANHYILLGELPLPIQQQLPDFETLWAMHPEAYYTITVMGRRIKTPRWQQAFGFDYAYSGSKQEAWPVGPGLQPLLDWCQTHIHPETNGLLLNWYDGSLGHYIGAHRDPDLVQGSPIITLSQGEERIFRFRRYREKGTGYRDFVVRHGTLLLIPWDTNQAWTHEVPRFKRYQKRRLSITLRAHLPQ